MMGRSKEEAPTIGLRKEINKTIPRSAAAESQLNGLCCLSGDKPFFDIILAKSHMKHSLVVPSHLRHIFPEVAVPVVLTHRDKKWNMQFYGRDKRPMLDYKGWRRFVADNNLKCHDACIFEVVESSHTVLRLRVVILRHVEALPLGLDVGGTPDTAIELD